jgi:hypothetical protein
MAVMFFCLLFIGALAVQVKLLQEFGTLFVAQNEVFKVPLSQYFAGPDLSFSFADQAVKDLSLVDPFSLEILVDIPYHTPESAGVERAPNLKLKTLRVGESQYVISYFSNNLVLVQQSAKTLEVLWDIPLTSLLKSPVIVDVEVPPSGCCFVLAVMHTTWDDWTIHDLFTLDTSTLTSPKHPKSLSISEVHELKDLFLSASESYLVVIGLSSSSPSQTRQLLIFQTPCNPSLVEIRRRFTFTDSFQPVAAQFLDNDTLVVVDAVYGLVQLKVSVLGSVETQVLPLARYGTSVSFDFQGTTGVVGMDDATIVVDLSNWSIKALHPLVQLDAVSPAKAANVELQDGFVFVNSYSDVSKNLALIDLSLPPSQSLVRNWSMLEEVPAFFNPFAPFAVFSNQDGTYSYVRHDFNGLRLIQLTVGEWTLEGVPMIPQQTVTITAANRITSSNSVHSSLTLMSIASSSIVAVRNMRAVEYPIEVEMYMKGRDSYVESLEIGSYFQGKDLSYKLEWEFSPYFELRTEITDEVIVQATSPLLDEQPIQGAEDSLVQLGTEVLVYWIEPFTAVTSIVLPGNAVATQALSRQGVLYLYSATAQAVFGYKDFLFNPTYIGSWQTAVPCTFFKKYNSYAFCGCSAALEVFTFTAEGELQSLFELTKEEPPFEIVDFTAGSAYFGPFSRDFVYLLDQTLGLVYFRLDLITTSTTSVELSRPISQPSDITFLCSTGDQVTAIHTNGDIEMYSILYNEPPYLNKTLSLHSEVTAADFTPDFFAVQHGDSLSLIDPYASTTSVIMKMYANNPRLAFAAIEGAKPSLVRETYSGSTYSYEVITLHRQRPAPSSPYSLSSKVSVYASQPEDIERTVYEIAGVLLASNSESSLEVKTVMRIFNSGQVIVSKHDLPTSALDINYAQSYSLDLDSVFSGQDVQLRLIINDILPALSYHKFNADPAVLLPKVELTDYASTDCSRPFFDMAVLAEEKLVLVTSKEAVLIFAVTDALQSRDFPPAALYDSISFATHLNETASCYDIEVGQRAGGTLVFFTACQYSNAPSLIDQFTFVEWTYEVTSRVVLSVQVRLTPFFPAKLKAKSPYLLGVDRAQPAGSIVYTNNHLMWTTSSEIHTEDFYSLNLDSFYASAVDALIAKDNQLFIYVADSQYGLRVLRVDKAKAHVVFSLPLHSPAVSLGVCGSVLFVGDSVGAVFYYDLKHPEHPVFLGEYFKTEAYTGLQGAIECSYMHNDLQYISVPLLSASGDFTIRVFDFLAAKLSAIFYDITMSPLCDVNHSCAAEFLDNSLTGLSQVKMLNFRLRSPYLDIQAMTEEQHKLMEDKWGTTQFQLKLLATNDFYHLNSSTILLSREGPTHHPDDHPDDHPDEHPDEHPDDHPDEHKSLSWWVWGFVGVAVLVVIGLVSFAVVHLYFKRRDRHEVFAFENHDFSMISN